MTTGVGLFSGGLDSILAVCVLRQQDIRVVPVVFTTPFFGAQTAQQAVGQLGLELQIVDITDAHLQMLRNPRYGYGRNMNPCIDCHGLMLRRAGEIMRDLRADFVFTGEVLGERPMSQNRGALQTVARLAGIEGRVLRPLSAQLLPETIPEQLGLVDRARLCALQGRSRKPQLALAESFALRYFPEPAGGCRLTDPIYSLRLRDLLDHCADTSRRDFELLNLGRHLRLSPAVKIVVGRNQAENDMIMALRRQGDTLITIEDVPSPTVIMPGGGDEAAVGLAAAVCVRYSDARGGDPVRVTVTTDTGRMQRDCRPCPEHLVEEFLIGQGLRRTAAVR
jgi:hypothetical protein